MTCGRWDRGGCNHPDGFHHHGPCLNLEGWREPIFDIPWRYKDKAAKVIWAEVRGGGANSGYGPIPGVYVGGESTSPAKSYMMGRPTDRRKYFFANNKAQVRDFILSRMELFHDVDNLWNQAGRLIQRRAERQLRKIPRAYGPFQFINMSLEEWVRHVQNKESVKKESIMAVSSNSTNVEILRREAERLLLRADAIAARPEDPFPDFDPNEPEPMLIWWRQQFRSGTATYTYAAIKTELGWYTTGPRTPKQYSWTDLVNWIYENFSDEVGEVEIWVATEFGLLG